MRHQAFRWLSRLGEGEREVRVKRFRDGRLRFVEYVCTYGLRTCFTIVSAWIGSLPVAKNIPSSRNSPLVEPNSTTRGSLTQNDKFVK